MDNNSLQIRLAQKKDLALVFQMIKELADFHDLSDKVKATEEILQYSLFEDPKGPDILIAEEKNQPIGFIVFFQNFSTFLGREGIYIEDLYIREKYRSKGYGKALLKEVCRIAEKRKCGRVEWKVLKGNQKAIGFYQKMGAIPASEWTTFRLTEPAFKALLK